MQAEEIIRFWFQEIEPSQWFRADPVFDELVRNRFQGLHEQAARGELWTWRERPAGALAEIIILDQFSRNMFRGSADAYAWDPLALALAQEAVGKALDRQLQGKQRAFLYMPYMHSEAKEVHQQAVMLFSQPGLEENLRFELRHQEVIERFGRYPHRNACLGRESTAEETEFLRRPGSGF